MKKYIITAIFILCAFFITNAQQSKFESMGFGSGFADLGMVDINGQIVFGQPMSGIVETRDGQVKAEIGLFFSAYSEINSVGDNLQVIKGITLLQNYPNPATAKTTIEFQYNEDNPGLCNLIIMNSLGEEVEHFTLQPEGRLNTININTENYPSGVYQYIIQNGTESIGNKLEVVR